MHGYDMKRDLRKMKGLLFVLAALVAITLVFGGATCVGTGIRFERTIKQKGNVQENWIRFSGFGRPD